MDETEESIYNSWKVLSVLSLIFLLITSKFVWEKWRYLKMMAVFDGPEPESFLLGHWNILTLPVAQLYHIFGSLAKKYYPHFGIRIFHVPAVTIFSPEDCEIILGTKKHTTKSLVYNTLKGWLRNGLLLSSGKKWLHRRKILTPTFHFSILKKFVHIFNKEAENVIRVIADEVSKPIDIVPIISEYTLRSINETAMGYRLDENTEAKKEYRGAIRTLEDYLLYRLMRPWLYSDLIYMLTPTYWKERKYLQILHSFTRNVIKERMTTFQKVDKTDYVDESDDFMKNRGKLAMLDVLLQANADGNQISYEGISEEVDTFMFEGFDTTSVAINFCLMLLANHPHIQENIHNEVESILGHDGRKPTIQDLQKMDYLERCIKESLRLYPSVHFISRLIDEDTKLNSGLILPKGAMVHILIFFLHRNPKIYPDPESFDPDRFLVENCLKRHPYAYIPFSAGPRNCIGQKFAILEMKSLISRIILNFRMKPIDSPDTIVLEPEMVLRTQKGIKIEFQRRI